MNVKNIDSNNLNFKSGLTWKIIKDIKQTDVLKSQADFAKLGLDADFRGKKSVCANYIYAANILAEISDKYKLPFNFIPYAIRVYKNEELVKPGYFYGFCINDTGKILKKEPSFIGGSIFVNDYRSGLLENDYMITKHYLLGRRSSPHFLANAFHEWFHAIHMDLMYKKYGYGGICPVLKEEYDRAGKVNKGLNKYESLNNRDMSALPDSFKKFIGKYAIISNSMLELFAELMTKITTMSLDKDLKVIKNPLDNLPKDLPNDVKYELERIMDI